MATHRGTRQARYPRFDTHQILGEQMTRTYPPEPFYMSLRVTPKASRSNPRHDEKIASSGYRPPRNDIRIPGESQ